MANYSDDGLTPLFHALSDPTRRAVLARLSLGEASVSELSKTASMALPSFVQHLGVLEKAGLVRSQKSGRVRTLCLCRDRLKVAEHWLSQQSKVWETRLNQLDTYLLTMKDDTP